MQKQGSCLLLLATKDSDKCQLLIKVSPDLVKKKIFASDLIKQLAPLIGGGGGGKKDLAQAGGKNPSGLDEAFQTLPKLLEGMC
jgi:alanyl-tRNA synthetase